MLPMPSGDAMNIQASMLLFKKSDKKKEGEGVPGSTEVQKKNLKAEADKKTSLLREEAAEEAEKDEHAEEAGGDLTQEQKEEIKDWLILTRERLREECRARQLKVGGPKEDLARRLALHVPEETSDRPSEAQVALLRKLGRETGRKVRAVSFTTKKKASEEITKLLAMRAKKDAGIEEADSVTD